MAPRRTSSTSTPTQFANYASNGSLYAYGDQVDNADDFYPALRDTFTFEDTLHVRPEGLLARLPWMINTDAWAEGRPHRRRHPDRLGPAGRRGGEADLGRRRSASPSAPALDRVGAFMAQATAGWWLNERRHRGDRRQPGEPRRPAPTSRTTSRPAPSRMSSDLDAGWGGEAFGTEQGRDDHRGQLDQRRHDQRLPRRRTTPSRRAARRPRRRGHPAVHPAAGGSRRSPTAQDAGRRAWSTS